ncbi:hypothetical protein D9619_000157 [Psilocybe cf. subviscida]|uniref:Protein kinase domain-containing protein n=1 Tax=Psilocybe cf. subviscida TaxID=2480587 RepID=A0A8H5F270_9AGAR|nr:hypothetical protein D9619_000157 [Psilocybe cf. subviscida]
MFSGAKNVRIGGRASFQISNFSARTESVDEGIRLLVERVVTSAMYNSGERFDAPTCHEETRTAIQDDLLGWADELVDDLNKLVTWLCGPAGAGKSAIAQTIAEKLHDRGQLTASFFFSRASGSDGRGEETNFIATLAYQLSQSVPATQPHIATAVRTNPLVFDLALRDQVEALIVTPLIAVSKTSSSSERPKVIVVDGLDECRQEKDAQRRVVDALVSGLRRVPHHTHKLFITSRPEYNIVAIFNRHTDKLLRRMVLDNRWNPDEDIRTFLNSSFADIRRSHFYFRKHPVDHQWPSTEDVETLVERSSGQFIYASVVLKYIKSEENYNPVARLNTILQLNNNGDRPYVELDALYHHIFSQIQDAERVRILTILHLDQEYGKLIYGMSAPKFGTFLSQFMAMDEDEIEFCLRPLLSLLVWEEGPDEGSEEGPEEGSSESGKKHGGIHYMHASLLDFLSDQSRSDNFCINMKMCAAGIVRRAISLLEDVIALTIPRCMTPLITILTHYLGHMPDGDEAFHIYSLLSNFNIVETMLCKIGVDLIKASDSSFALTGYLKWVLEESERDDALHSQKALLQPTVARIQTWLVNQFEQLDFHDLANTKKVDVWPFFAPAMINRRDYPEDVSEILSSALEICGSSLSCHRLLHGTKFDLSNSQVTTPTGRCLGSAFPTRLISSLISTMVQRHSFTAFNSVFVVDAEYQFVKELYRGYYECAVSVRHSRSGEGCAIKKIINVNTKVSHNDTFFRWIRAYKLPSVSSPSDACAKSAVLSVAPIYIAANLFPGFFTISIPCLYDMDIVFQPNGNFNEVYLYEELMEANLHAIILSGQPLTDAHVQSFIHQTLCGLKYIHSANMLHCDLRPMNLLVNADCELKICGFELACGYTPGVGTSKVEGNVVGRWYHAPEVMLSLNCVHYLHFSIFTSMAFSSHTGSLLRVSTQYLSLTTIISLINSSLVDCYRCLLCGPPSADFVLSRSPIRGDPPPHRPPRAQDYIRSLSTIKRRVPFSTLFPSANALAIDLLSQILCFDPARRMSCEQALNHPYLQIWHDPADEPICDSVGSLNTTNAVKWVSLLSYKKFDFGVGEEDSTDDMKRRIIHEVSIFRAEVRTQARAASQIRRQDSLPMPSRDKILSSPVQEYGPHHDATFSFTFAENNTADGIPSPIMNDLREELEREVASTHIAGRG